MWTVPGPEGAASVAAPCPVVSAALLLQLTPAPRQTTGNCGDTKMGATYMTSSSRARTYTTYALRYMASQKHMTLQKGSCKQAGYTKFVGNKKYRWS